MATRVVYTYNTYGRIDIDDTQNVNGTGKAAMLRMNRRTVYVQWVTVRK